MLKTTLSELICTRINHDIIGNVGAVANAVELLEEGDMDFLEDISNILKTSSFTLNARLKFFRWAFGIENTTVGSVMDVKEACADYLKTIGNVNFPIALEFDVNGLSLYKVAMIAVMIGADTFIKGGKIIISQKQDGLSFYCSSVNPMSAERVDTIKAIFLGQDIDPAAKYAPVYYLQELLTNMGYNLYLNDVEGFGFVIKKDK